MEDIKAAGEGDIFSLASSLGKKAASAAQAIKPSEKEQTQELKVPEITPPAQEQHEAPAPTRSPRPGRR